MRRLAIIPATAILAGFLLLSTGASAAATTLYLTDSHTSVTGSTADQIATSPPNTPEQTCCAEQVGTRVTPFWVAEEANYNGCCYTAIEAPSGTQFVYDSTALEGTTIPAGTWTFNQDQYCNCVSATFDLHVLYFVRSASGSYTKLLEAVSPATTITGQTSNVHASGSAPAVTFGVGDKLYVEVWLDVTATNGFISTSFMVQYPNGPNDNISFPAGPTPTPPPTPTPTAVPTPTPTAAPSTFPCLVLINPVTYSTCTGTHNP